MVHADAQGRNGKMLDMRTVINGQEVGVEVKAPYQEPEPPRQCWIGDDASRLRQCLDTANTQFSNDVANILIIVPHLRTSVFNDRVQLVSALYGQEKIILTMDTETGTTIDETTKFFPDGRLLRRRLPNGRWLKPSRDPGFTRVSAVIVVEERMEDKQTGSLHSARKTKAWIDHDILVAHNPHALYPMSPDFFRCYVQFMDLGGGYGWSDGESL